MMASRITYEHPSGKARLGDTVSELQLAGEGLLRAAVRHQLHTSDESSTADIAHIRQVSEYLMQPLVQVRADVLPHLAQQPLLPHHRLHREPCGARGRVGGEGVARRNGAVLGFERTTLCSAVAIVRSYTWQPAGLLWLPIELKTLDISSMVYYGIADLVA